MYICMYTCMPVTVTLFLRLFRYKFDISFLELYVAGLNDDRVTSRVNHGEPPNKNKVKEIVAEIKRNTVETKLKLNSWYCDRTEYICTNHVHMYDTNHMVVSKTF